MIRATVLAIGLIVLGPVCGAAQAAAETLEEALALQLSAGVGAAATDDEIETLTVLERFYQDRAM